MESKDAVRQLRKLAKDLINCPCFQNIEGWDSECCKKWECEFLKEEDCEVQTRYNRVMVETNPDPDFDDWLRHGMPTDPDFLCR